MKTMFKPLGLVAAVAAASAGYAGIVNAQATLSDNSGLGDMAIVPYYTTQAGWTSGVSIINTSQTLTQVVKIRLRRASDSMDALDFNVVMSPNDVYTGYVAKEDDDTIRFYSNDNSCTAPAYSLGGNYFEMPNIYREGAEEGYIEVIGMAAADAGEPISQDAKHNSAGVPNDCARVRDNFFPGDTNTDYATGLVDAGRRGVIDSTTTHQYTSSAGTSVEDSTYVDSPNSLKVSYFLKSDLTSTEFGNDAVHISDFMSGPSMTNQRFGLADGDLQGFDYPDLNGGAVYSATIDPVSGAAARGKYEPLRDTLGAIDVINDWSANTGEGPNGEFTVDTDWVVTTPGQYLMANRYILGERAKVEGIDIKCIGGTPGVSPGGPDEYNSLDGTNCDFRDIPMTATFTVYDREERGVTLEEGDLVVSPQPPGEIQRDVLDREVNIIRWGVAEVIAPNKVITVPTPEGAEAGWSRMAVTQWSGTTQGVCDITALAGVAPAFKPTVAQPFPVTCASTSTPIPLVGFVAWQRNFGGDARFNYGRIVEHSFTTSS